MPGDAASRTLISSSRQRSVSDKVTKSAFTTWTDRIERPKVDSVSANANLSSRSASRSRHRLSRKGMAASTKISGVRKGLRGLGAHGSSSLGVGPEDISASSHAYEPGRRLLTEKRMEGPTIYDVMVRTTQGITVVEEIWSMNVGICVFPLRGQRHFENRTKRQCTTCRPPHQDPLTSGPLSTELVDQLVGTHVRSQVPGEASPTQIRLICIIRVSTAEQAADDRAGIPRQQESVREIAAAHNATYEFVTVSDVSGSDLRLTDEWRHQVLPRLEGPDVHVAVDSIDRLCRPTSSTSAS